ncbi:hypothetical protein OIV83_003709 [Microbotryomycetes sp. JL201]|nr:hypothetical protein OIV83_003709 [Microbotryomycetes sp. JL201]
MAPAAKASTGKVTPFTNPLPAQADDSRYKQKYVELKIKLKDLEDVSSDLLTSERGLTSWSRHVPVSRTNIVQDNANLALRVLQSKKAIQRLRLQRAILYDRLQQTTAPTNPYALKSSTHLAHLAKKMQSDQADQATSSTMHEKPPTILDNPSYATKQEHPRQTLLGKLDEIKLKVVAQNPQAEFGSEPVQGVKGEQQILDGRQPSPEGSSDLAETKPSEQEPMQLD